MSLFNLLVMVVVVLCWELNITAGRPTDVLGSPGTFGLSSMQAFENYKKNVKELKLLMAKWLNKKIDVKSITPQFDDMIFPINYVLRLIRRYQILLKQRKKKRPKRKIMEFRVDKPDNRWNISEKIMYLNLNKPIAKETDKAIQHWEKHTCIQFKKMSSFTFTAKYHIQFVGHRDGAPCRSVIGRFGDGNSFQEIFLGTACKPYVGVAMHEIGHALGLFHEHATPHSQKFITIHEENVAKDVTDKSFLWSTQLIVSLGLPYDFNSIMHYGGFQAAANFTAPVIATNDPLYQRNIGQRVELSFLDKKIINLEYCKDACSKTLRCHRSGFTNPKNCMRCVCPDGFGGNLCQTVSDVHHSACQTPQIINVREKEQCITMKAYETFTECNWHLKASSGQKIQVYFVNDFSVFCNDQFVCYHWVEVKYKGDLSFPGPRFCCKERPSAKLLSDANLVVVSFKSNFAEGVKPAYRTGFQLCFKLGSCPITKVLTCNTMNEWKITTKPKLSKEDFKAAIKGCTGEVEAGKKISFNINLVGDHAFKIDKVCVTRPGARSAQLKMESPTGGFSNAVFSKEPCLDANSFSRIGAVKKLTIELRSKKTMSIKDIELEVCRETS